MFCNKLLFLFLLSKIKCGCTDRPPQTKYHTVQLGESLWKIARKYGIELSKLIAANPQIKDPNLIFPGQVIVIPL